MAILKPTFSLTIGSLTSDTDNAAGGPTAIVIDRDMDIPTDSLRLNLMDRSGISLGDDVSIELGHDGENETAFTGNVIGLKPTIVSTEILALGKMNDLLNTYTSGMFEEVAVGGIASDLIGQAGLSEGTVDDGPTLPRFAVDHRISAFAHVKDLADRLGFELYADRDGNIMFHALGPAADLDSGLGGLGGAVAGLLGGGGEGYAYGQHLVKAGTDRQNPAWGAVDVGGESPMSGQGDTTVHWLTVNDSDYKGSSGSCSPTQLVLDPVARTKDLADRFAAGRVALAARKAHEIKLTVLGRPQVDLGDSISSNELPDDLINGEGYIRAIRHRFGDRWGFLTDLKISVVVD